MPDTYFTAPLHVVTPAYVGLRIIPCPLDGSDCAHRSVADDDAAALQPGHGALWLSTVRRCGGAGNDVLFTHRVYVCVCVCVLLLCVYV